MIENGRDEDDCRQMDVLADEDHTHHLTPQEYDHYKSNWWLTSKKTGANTVPVERRPDFNQALSTLQQLKQKEEGAQRKSTMGTEFFFFFTVELARFHGNEPSTDRSGVTCYASIWNKSSSGHYFLEFIYFVTDGSFTADGGQL